MGHSNWFSASIERLRSRKARRSHSSDHADRCFQPRVEVLEDRSVPSVVTVGPSTAPALPAQFGSDAAFQQYLINEAVQEYGGLFGQPVYLLYADPIMCYDSVAPVLATPAASVAAGSTSLSTTATQSSGVDQGDIVTTDGHNLYLLSNNSLVILNATSATSLQTLSVTMLPGTPLAEYLDGDRLTVISQEYTWGFPIVCDWAGPNFAEPGVLVTWVPAWRTAYSVDVSVFDVSNPAAPSIVQETTLGGSYNTSWAIGSNVYVAVNNTLSSLPSPTYGLVSDGDTGYFAYETQAQYVASMETYPFDAMLPQYTTTYTDAAGAQLISGYLNAPADIYQPVVAGDTNLVSLVSFDMSDGATDLGPTQSVSFLAGGSVTFYAATDNAYLISSEWTGSTNFSVIDQLSLQNGGITLTATGQVPGTITTQNAVNENGSYLYIATTNWDTGSNNLYVLTANNGSLNVAGELDNLTPGDAIASVTFVGDRAFIATLASQTNPILAVDLSDPTDPTVAGSLPMSSGVQYLQAIDGTHLIGIGENCDPGTDYVNSLTISLYDISNVANPTLLGSYNLIVNGAWEGYADYQSITYNPALQELAFPVTAETFVNGPFGYSYWTSATDLAVLHVDTASGTITQQGSISDLSPMQRGVFVGNTLYAISQTSVQSFDLSVLGTPIAQVPLPVGITLWFWPEIIYPIYPIVIVTDPIPVTTLVPPTPPAAPMGPSETPADPTSGNSTPANPPVVVQPVLPPVIVTPVVVGWVSPVPVYYAVPEVVAYYAEGFVLGPTPIVVEPILVGPGPVVPVVAPVPLGFYPIEIAPVPLFPIFEVPVVEAWYVPQFVAIAPCN